MILVTRSHIHNKTIELKISDNLTVPALGLAKSMVELCQESSCKACCRSPAAIFQMVWIDEDLKFYRINPPPTPNNIIRFIEIIPKDTDSQD